MYLVDGKIRTLSNPKKKNKKQIQQILKLLSVNGGTMSYSQVAELHDISARTLMRYQLLI